MVLYVYQGSNSLEQPKEYSHWPRGMQAWFQPVAALENCWLISTISINSADCCWKKLPFSLQIQIPKSQLDAHPSQAVLICFPSTFAFLLFLPSFSFLLLFSNPVTFSLPCPGTHIARETHLPLRNMQTGNTSFHHPQTPHILCIYFVYSHILCWTRHERLISPLKLWILLPLMLSDVIPESSCLSRLSSVSPPLAYSQQCKNMLYSSSFKIPFLVFLFFFNYHLFLCFPSQQNLWKELHELTHSFSFLLPVPFIRSGSFHLQHPTETDLIVTDVGGLVHWSS